MNEEEQNISLIQKLVKCFIIVLSLSVLNIIVCKIINYNIMLYNSHPDICSSIMLYINPDGHSSGLNYKTKEQCFDIIAWFLGNIIALVVLIRLFYIPGLSALFDLLPDLYKKCRNKILNNNFNNDLNKR